MGTVWFKFNFFLQWPKYIVLSMLSCVSVCCNYESFIWWKLGIICSVLTKKPFVLKSISEVEMNSFSYTDTKIGSHTWKDHLLNGKTKLGVFSRKSWFRTFVQMVKPLQIEEFVLPEEELTACLLVKVVFDFARGSSKSWYFKLTHCLLLFFNQGSNFIRPNAAHLVVTIEFEVVQTIEGCLGFNCSFIG